MNALTLAAGLAAFMVIGIAPPARAEPTAAESVAAQVRATRAANRQLGAAVDQMKRARRAPRHTVERTAGRPATRTTTTTPASPAPPALGAGAEPVGATAGKQLQVGPLTITPGGFLELQTRSQ